LKIGSYSKLARVRFAELPNLIVLGLKEVSRDSELALGNVNVNSLGNSLIARLLYMGDFDRCVCFTITCRLKPLRQYLSNDL
jgi:hypothetical protein